MDLIFCPQIDSVLAVWNYARNKTSKELNNSAANFASSLFTMFH